MSDNIGNVLVTSVPLGPKDALLEAEPARHRETPHYACWAVMFMGLGAVSDALADFYSLRSASMGDNRDALIAG